MTPYHSRQSLLIVRFELNPHFGHQTFGFGRNIIRAIFTVGLRPSAAAGQYKHARRLRTAIHCWLRDVSY